MKNFVSDYRIRRKQYLAKHKKTEITTEYIYAILMMLFTAFISALTFKIFLSPNAFSTTDPNMNAIPIISGGLAGVARSIGLIFHMTIDRADEYMTLIYSITYTVVNIPVFYLAFRRIGFRFALLTVIQVVATSLFTNFINLGFEDHLAKSIACVISVGDSTIQAGLLTRAILAGVFTGLSSALALSFGGSAGGGDTVSYYFSMRKSSNVGRFIISINAVVFIIFAILNAISEKVVNNFDMTTQIIPNAIMILLFELIFSFMTSLVIDAITNLNKKEQIQIITKVENLSKLLLTHIPHGATIVRSKGAFTGEDRIIIYVVVSTYETKEVVKLVRDTDPNSFINVTSVKQVYGRFARPKVK